VVRGLQHCTEDERARIPARSRVPGAVVCCGRMASQKDGAVRQIRPRDDVFDAVQNGRPGSLKQNLVLLGVELADRKAAAARKAA
jgi:hypothetical protein